MKKKKSVDISDVLHQIKSNPEGFKLIKNVIAENDERFKAVKSAIYADLLEKETPKEKCEYLLEVIKQLSNRKVKHEAQIHEKSTLKQKLNAFEKKEIIFGALISFCKHHLAIQQEILKAEESLGINGTENDLSGKKTGKKLKRDANDKLTCLNQVQTVLLIHYLQQAKVILKDEYLSDLDAGKAFEILTRYSPNTLRQDLGKIDKIKTKENLKVVESLLTRMSIAISNDIKAAISPK